MKYTLQHAEDFTKYIITNMTLVTGEPELGEYSIDDDTGIITVNANVDNDFTLAVPVYNLKLGDYVRASVELKKISGSVSPHLGNTLNLKSTNNSNINSGGAEGTHRFKRELQPMLGDMFQTVSLEAIYEGITNTNTPVTFSANEYGLMYMRLFLPSGYGPSKFKIKQFTIETDTQPTGLYPSTRMYYGTLELIGGVPNIRGKSHNFRDFTLTIQNNRYINLTFNRRIRSGVTTIVHTTVQSGGNLQDYEIAVNTESSQTILFIVVDKATKTMVTDFSTITKDLYANFLIIGE